MLSSATSHLYVGDGDDLVDASLSTPLARVALQQQHQPLPTLSAIIQPALLSTLTHTVCFLNRSAPANDLFASTPKPDPHLFGDDDNSSDITTSNNNHVYLSFTGDCQQLHVSNSLQSKVHTTYYTRELIGVEWSPSSQQGVTLRFLNGDALFLNYVDSSNEHSAVEIGSAVNTVEFSMWRCGVDSLFTALKERREIERKQREIEENIKLQEREREEKQKIAQQAKSNSSSSSTSSSFTTASSSTSSSILPCSSASPPLPFHCIFGMPSLSGEGITAHTTYVIHTRWAPAAELQPSKAIRRYTDFALLQQQCTLAHPECLIPCLPPKDFANRFDPAFIAARRRGLLRFLSSLALHPLLATLSCVRSFLTLSVDEWEVEKDKWSRSSNTGILASLSYYNNKLVNSLTRPPSADTPHSHDQHYMDALESSEHHSCLHKCYNVTMTRLRDVVEQEREVANSWLSIYPLISQSEDDDLFAPLLDPQPPVYTHAHINLTSELLSASFTHFLTVTHTIGQLIMKKTDTDCVALLEVLEFHTNMFEQVEALFERRLELSRKLQDAELSLNEATLQAAVLKNHGHEDASNSSFEENKVKALIQQCTAVCDDARRALTTFHNSVCSEISSYTAKRRKDLKKLVCDMIKIQLGHEEQIRNQWQKVLEDMEQIEK